MLARQHHVAIVQQRFAVGFLFYLCGAVESVFYAPETLDEFNRALIADTGSAGDVVDRVTAQGHHVDDAIRRHSQDLLNLGSVANQVVLGRVQDTDSFVHQLQHVFIAGDDVDRVRLGGGFFGERADHVVCLVAFGLQNRNAVSLQRSADVRDLLGQIAGHLGAIGLITAVSDLLKGLRLRVKLADVGDGFRLLVAEGSGADIEHGSKIFGGEIVSQLTEHVHEHISGRGRDASFRRHGTLPCHGMVRAENEGHRVDQENSTPLAVGQLSDQRRRSLRCGICNLLQGCLLWRQALILAARGQESGQGASAISKNSETKFITRNTRFTKETALKK